MFEKLSGYRTIILAVVTGLLEALRESDVPVPKWLVVASAALTAIFLRIGLGNDVKKAADKVLPMLLVLAAAVGCATPIAEQGKAAQGGSVTAPPISLTVNIGTGGGITTTNTSAPTAAPASASTATSAQTAEAKPDLNLGTDAIKAATTPLLGGTSSAVDAVVPKVKPTKTEPAPAPTPLPEPVPVPPVIAPDPVK